MILSIDHIVILVSDLAQATADYTELGFVVVLGGEHSDGTTHNALIAFADGTYLELIAFKQPNPQHRWWRYQAWGEGLIDFALLPDAIESDLAAAHKNGLEMAGPFPGGRLRPDGQAISWQTATPSTPDLPFLCADVTPRNLRVPSGAAWNHPNGVIGIRDLTILVANLKTSTKRYKAMLGHSRLPLFSPYTIFKVGSHPATISLEEALNEEDRNYLARHGEGPCRLHLVTNKQPPSIQLPNLTQTHGVWLALSWAESR